MIFEGTVLLFDQPDSNGNVIKNDSDVRFSSDPIPVTFRGNLLNPIGTCILKNEGSKITGKFELCDYISESDLSHFSTSISGVVLERSGNQISALEIRSVDLYPPETSKISTQKSRFNRVYPKGSESPTIVVRYKNRKFYNTKSAQYIKLGDILKLVQNKENIRIIEHQTREDITLRVLTQVILENGENTSEYLPLNTIQDIIQNYNGSLPRFLKGKNE